MYCPKCGSKLYPADEEYMKSKGVCSYCVTYVLPKLSHGEKISKDYEERAKAEREAGGSVEVNERFPTIGLKMSNGDEYFMQGEEAEKLIDEYWAHSWIECSLEDYLLAIAQNW